MLGLDYSVTHYIATIAGRMPLLDFALLEFGSVDSFKMLPLTAVLFWLWAAAKSDEQRRKVIVIVLGAAAAMLLTRVLQDFAPNRPRPIQSGLFPFTISTDKDPVKQWSSFPSDTSGLAFALAAGIALASRRLGVLAFLWAAFVAAGKLYSGYHYLTDIMAGGLLGISVTYGVARTVPHLDPAFRWVERLYHRYPGPFALLAFGFAFQLTTLFDDVRWLGHRLPSLLHRQPALGEPSHLLAQSGQEPMRLILGLAVLLALAVGVVAARHLHRIRSRAGHPV